MRNTTGLKPFSLQRALHTNMPLRPGTPQQAPFDYCANKSICCMDPFGMNRLNPSISWCYADLNIPELLDVGLISCIKIAIEPVWELSAVAERLQMTTQDLRNLIYTGTGGAFPNVLIPDVTHFLPPIGTTTVYIFGDLSNKDKGVTVRIQDECNSSDVFGATICTCRQSLMYGVEQAVEQCEKGGVGVVMYCRNEGRALGEVTKFRVYQDRSKGEDSPDAYFKATTSVAHIEDARTPILQMDPLMWLGIHKIHTLVGESEAKLETLKQLNIEVMSKIPVPDRLLPEQAATEIQAKKKRNTQ